MEYTMRCIKEDKKSVVEKVFIALLGDGIDVDEEIEYQVGNIDEIDDIKLANTVLENEIEL